MALGTIFPDFSAQCTTTKDTPAGKISMHEWIDDSWAIIFSHPAAFTPICTTELAAVAQLKSDLDMRGVKVGQSSGAFFLEHSNFASIQSTSNS